MKDNSFSRRGLLTGAAGVAASLAGCSSQNDTVTETVEDTVNEELTPSEQDENEKTCQSKEYFLDSKESDTKTMGGSEYRLELLRVGDNGNSAVMKVNGELDKYTEDDTYNLNGVDVTLEDAIKRSDEPDIVKLSYKEC